MLQGGLHDKKSRVSPIILIMDAAPSSRMIAAIAEADIVARPRLDFDPSPRQEFTAVRSAARRVGTICVNRSIAPWWTFNPG